MADRHEKKSNDSKPDKIVVVPKNSAEVQKIHVQRLMRNFVRNLPSKLVKHIDMSFFHCKYCT